MSQESSVYGILLELEMILTRRYPVKFINHQQCFLKPSGEVFTVRKFPGSEAIVVEYAESEADALLYRFEDGDRFYLDEMEAHQLIQVVLREIEG